MCLEMCIDIDTERDGTSLEFLHAHHLREREAGVGPQQVPVVLLLHCAEPVPPTHALNCGSGQTKAYKLIVYVSKILRYLIVA